MNFAAMRTLIICAFGVATIAGCASTSSSPAVASAQRNVQSGKITAVETTAVVEQSVAGTSSGNSAVVTTATGGPSLITVRFDDGKESRYIIEHPMAAHTVGEPVYVITNGDQIGIARR